MPVRSIAVGRREEATQPDSMRAVLAEFISTFIFVLAGEGSVMALAKITGGAPTDAAGMVAIAVAHGLGMAVAVAAAFNSSGGHINPAVTAGALVGGHVSLVRAVLYCLAQILGAVVACAVLKLSSNGMSTHAFRVMPGIGAWHAVLLEAAMTFALVYTVYATALDPKRGVVGSIAPLAIGFVVAANVLAGGAFDGASMNPARALAPALLSGMWRHHWVFWLGPLLGGIVAGLIYELLLAPSSSSSSSDPHGSGTHQPLQTEDY